jgi:hypothetical protein
LNFFLWKLVGGDGGREHSFGSLSTLAMEKKQESHKVQRVFLSGPCCKVNVPWPNDIEAKKFTHKTCTQLAHRVIEAWFTQVWGLGFRVSFFFPWCL